MRTIIVDDEKMSILIVRKICKHFNFIDVIGEFSSGIEALEFVRDNRVDLIFLDIEMPNFTGLDFIEEINMIDIVVISSKKDFAFDLFANEAVISYLQKPIDKNSMKLALDKVVKKKMNALNDVPRTSQEVNNYVYLYVDKSLVQVNVNDIYVVESRGDYVLLKTIAKNFLIYGTAKNILEKLPTNFLRVHKSFIVNTDMIRAIDDCVIKIHSDLIPVSRTYYREIRNRLIRLN